jgi:hypothetical protein
MMDMETGRIMLRWEVLAGGMAGGCQVVCILNTFSLLLLKSALVGLYQPIRDRVGI